VILSHKIRLEPALDQVGYFFRACGTSRFTYNWALVAWKEAYEGGKFPSGRSLKASFNAVRREQFPWTYDVHRDCTSRSFDNLQAAFLRFFKHLREGKRPGYPKFKKKGRSRDSFYVSNDKFRLDGKNIRLPKLGWVKMRESLRFEGKVMSAVVVRSADKWFVSIAVDTEVAKRPPKTKEAVGVDLGISALATMSNGEKIHYSSRLSLLEKQIARLQRSVSRKQKGSSNRKKAIVKLSRKHWELTNVRGDALHKLTSNLVATYPVIVIEDLNVQGMVRNRRLSRAISRQAWGAFKSHLAYKTVLHERQLVIADRFFPSTKLCSSCGSIRLVALSERTYSCPTCGLSIDRDTNAAINLLNLGAGSPNVKPVERGALTSRSIAGETILCEAGTSSEQFCSDA